MTVGGITVDVCRGGCGGIWFDRYELMKADEPHESAGEELLHTERAADVNVDHSKRVSCPKCPGVVMMRHFFSVKRQVAVDECPSCGGYWLGVGELATIRSEFETEEERNQAAARAFSELFGSELAAEHAQTTQDLEAARRVAHVLRFICPSYYIPGKQGWGHFDRGVLAHRTGACEDVLRQGNRVCPGRSKWGLVCGLRFCRFLAIRGRQRMSNQTSVYLVDAQTLYERDARELDLRGPSDLGQPPG
jgi:Zn-finger nucleic acid-binding protein